MGVAAARDEATCQKYQEDANQRCRVGGSAGSASGEGPSKGLNVGKLFLELAAHHGDPEKNKLVERRIKSQGMVDA